MSNVMGTIMGFGIAQMIFGGSNSANAEA